MIEKRYQFFIDTIPQDEYFIKTTYAKQLSSVDLITLSKLKNNFPNTARVMSCITEYKVNTNNNFFRDFCKENAISPEIYQKIKKLSKDITVSYIELKDVNELPKDTILLNSIRLSYSYVNEQKNSSNFSIIKLKNNDFFEYDKFINIGNDLIFSDSLLRPIDKSNNISYRIYLDDRMLIERFFPDELPFSKIICEECYLSLLKPTSVKLVTDYDLIFSKIITHNQTTYPNSKEFILEP